MELVELPKDKDAGLGFESQQSEISQVMAAITTIIQLTCLSHGLSASTMSTDPDEQSGIARAWDKKELSENRADDVQLWRTYEHQLFDLVRTVWNVHSSNNKLSGNGILKIDFCRSCQGCNHSTRAGRNMG